MRRRRQIAAGLLSSVTLLGASPAAADVGVVRVSPNVAAPGAPIEVTIGCGSSQCPTRLPVSLVPVSHAPRPRPCHTNALCSPEAGGPPHSPPYLFLGSAAQRGTAPVGKQYLLRTRVPRARPATYAFVIFRTAGNHGSRGFLIANTTTPRFLLRVGAGQSSSGRSGTDITWWIAGGAAVIAIGVIAVALRRRRSA
jgi:hypothetical protein